MTLTNRADEKKSVYVVLGMSRTGTSAIARSLQAMGITLGSKLIAADSRNPKGFYEDKDVLYKINRGISRVIGNQWLRVDSLETRRLLESPRLQQFKSAAIQLVHDRLTSAMDWGFKDPRTDMLLPFWRVVLAEAGVDERYIIAVRNPLATAYSTQKFIGIDISAGLLLWLQHMIAVVDGTKGRKRTIIAYETLMQSPQKQVERLHKHLSVPHPLDESTLLQYTQEFLDVNLNHHVYTKEECAHHPAMRIAPLCLQLYELLMRAASDELSIDSDAFANEWYQIKTEYIQMMPIYNYVESLLEKNKRLEREIRGMRKSWSWKIMRPLRLVEQILRSRRRTYKEKQRLCLTK